MGQRISTAFVRKLKGEFLSRSILRHADTPKKIFLPFWHIQNHAYISQNGKIFCQNGKKLGKFSIFSILENILPFWKNICYFRFFFSKNIFQNVIFCQNGRIFFHFGFFFLIFFSILEDFFPEWKIIFP
jgi:hypothetical protein